MSLPLCFLALRLQIVYFVAQFLNSGVLVAYHFLIIYMRIVMLFRHNITYIEGYGGRQKRRYYSHKYLLFVLVNCMQMQSKCNANADSLLCKCNAKLCK